MPTFNWFKCLVQLNYSNYSIITIQNIINFDEITFNRVFNKKINKKY
jgi:hypothetical protein